MLVDEQIYLEHFGVKGMKWGVRRAQAHRQGGVEKAVNRQIRKAGEAHRAKKVNLDTAKSSSPGMSKRQRTKAANARIESAKKAITIQEMRGRAATSKKDREAAAKEVRKLAKQITDTDIAQTRVLIGGKAAHVLIAGPYALGTVPLHNLVRRNRLRDFRSESLAKKASDFTQ